MMEKTPDSVMEREKARRDDVDAGEASGW